MDYVNICPNYDCRLISAELANAAEFIVPTDSAVEYCDITVKIKLEEYIEHVFHYPQELYSEDSPLPRTSTLQGVKNILSVTFVVTSLSPPMRNFVLPFRDGLRVDIHKIRNPLLGQALVMA